MFFPLSAPETFFFSSDKYLTSDPEIRAGKLSLSPRRVRDTSIWFLTEAGKWLHMLVKLPVWAFYEKSFIISWFVTPEQKQR